MTAEDHDFLFRPLQYEADHDIPRHDHIEEEDERISPARITNPDKLHGVGRPTVTNPQYSTIQ